MKHLTFDARPVGRGLVLFGLGLGELLLATLFLVAVMLTGTGVGLFVLPALALAARRVTGGDRRLAGAWSGVEIPRPHLPRPSPREGFAGRWEENLWILRDPATWRDTAWGFVNPAVGAALALLPLALLANGLYGLLLPFLWEPIVEATGTFWYLMVPVRSATTAMVAAALGVVCLVLGLTTGRWALRTHARLARTLLAPTGTAQRVRHLTETRADAVNSSAAELRRLERDLHDGAQARLVAMGMNLSAAERLLADDPEAARAVLADTRRASAAALQELRDLVRGIHPPVLADRGLVDAVRALALDSPLEVTVSADVPERAEAPVESALYFAVTEALTNAAKHTGGARVSVELRYTAGLLRAQVTDDGPGGADPRCGTGLRGIERRLAAFDGLLAVTSPPGGPTTLTMELPCALSSPKTSSSSGTA